MAIQHFKKEVPSSFETLCILNNLINIFSKKNSSRLGCDVLSVGKQRAFRGIAVPSSSRQGTTICREVDNSSRQDVSSQKDRLSISTDVRTLKFPFSKILAI